MRLLSLEISQYKSITRPVRIYFKDKFITILGKNGSGKSTILSAIYDYFCIINDGFDELAKYEGVFKARIKVSNAECPYLELEKEDIIDVILDCTVQGEFEVYYKNEFICSFKDINNQEPFKKALLKNCNLLTHDSCFNNHELIEYVDSYFKWFLCDYCDHHNISLESLTDDQSKEVCVLVENKLYDLGIFNDYPRSAICFIYNDNKAFLSLKERNGQYKSICDTNTGRKWMLLYYIKKEMLLENEIFLIDEPASFLHPEAQLMILKDMENIAKHSSSMVIYSTHSPYMISTKYDYFYYSVNDYRGVKLSRHNIKDLHIARDEMKLININDILLHLDKTYILVEGISDVVCFKKFMDIFNVDKTLYEILQIDGAGNMKRISHFFKKNKLPYFRVLDADQKDKYFDDNDIIYVGEDSLEKRLEGLFSAIDRQRYFKADKVDATKISKGNHFSQSTIKNFKNLFIEIGLI